MMAPFGLPHPQSKDVNWAATLPSLAEDEAIRSYETMRGLVEAVRAAERRAEAMDRLEMALRRMGEGL